MHAAGDDPGVPAHLGGPPPDHEGVEPQRPAADRAQQSRLRRADAPVVDRQQVVGVEPGERRSVGADERGPERIVGGTQPPPGLTGIARPGGRRALRVPDGGHES
jgi:hypothetical protein